MMASDVYFNLVKAAKKVHEECIEASSDAERELLAAIEAAESELEPWQREELKCQQ